MPATRIHGHVISCENEDLPNIRNMCSIDGYLEMEEHVLQWKNEKETMFLFEAIIVKNFK